MMASCPCSWSCPAVCKAGPTTLNSIPPPPPSLPLPPPLHSEIFARLVSRLYSQCPLLRSVASFLAHARASWPFGQINFAPMSEHDYARLVSAGGGGGHVSIEMGERRVSDASDDTL
jgi:hypothetical protein